MDTEQLCTLIRREGIRRVVEATANPGTQATEGWDLTHWTAQTAPGAVLFRRWSDDRDDTVTVAAVLWLNVHQSERERWQSLVAEYPWPTTVLYAGVDPAIPDLPI